MALSTNLCKSNDLYEEVSIITYIVKKCNSNYFAPMVIITSNKAVSGDIVETASR